MISKQTFLAGFGCSAAGWYQARVAPETPGPGQEWQFHTGNDVGRLARTHLGQGTLLPFAPRERAVEATGRAMAEPDSALLFEASFAIGGFVARADALRRNEGGWEVIEVKSALLPDDGKVKGEHLDDMAYTTFVALATGATVTRCTLLFLDRESRVGDMRFGEVDVTDTALARAAEFAAAAPRVAAACTAPDRPAAALQFLCKRCDFFASDCVGKGVPDPLFILPRLSNKRFHELQPHDRLSAVPESVQLTEPQQRVFQAVRSGAPIIDRGVLNALTELVWPVYYLDFEAVAPAVPWFAGCAPYEVMPFQYSIHVCDRPGQETGHHEYLAPVGGDWRDELVVALIEQLGDRGSITTYTDYEEKRLAALAKRFPQHETALNAIIARLVDLEPLVRRGYCHPGFLGKTSIKNVLPVVAPELSYEAMAVGNGLDAEGLFALMTVGRRDRGEYPALRQQLLAYCKLDTLAMVRLHQALDVVRELG